MRPIDADYIMSAFGIFTDKEHGNEHFLYGIETAKEIVANAPTIGGWINVKCRLPVEAHSIFWRFHGTEKWSSAMWKEQSDKVLVTVAFKDGTKLVTTGETHDGVWHTSISRTLEPEVTHWMPLPEPPKEEH